MGGLRSDRHYYKSFSIINEGIFTPIRMVKGEAGMWLADGVVIKQIDYIRNLKLVEGICL